KHGEKHLQRLQSSAARDQVELLNGKGRQAAGAAQAHAGAQRAAGAQPPQKKITSTRYADIDPLPPAQHAAPAPARRETQGLVPSHALIAGMGLSAPVEEEVRHLKRMIQELKST